MYFEKCNCPLCGISVDHVVYPIDRDYAFKLSGISTVLDIEIGVAACSNCAHQFIFPCPKPNFLSPFYAAYMSGAKNGFYRSRYANEIPLKFKEHYTPWLADIKKILNKKNIELLDVGCGLGMFLRLARELEFIIQGLEPNEEAVQHLKTEY
ncbi:MAG: hypothetical protein R8L53_04085 [Mariprofundales bacterium]